MSRKGRAQLSRTDRISKILDAVEGDGRVDSRELASAFGVSEMTIRRDLRVLEQEGVVIRTHGGAVAKTGTSSEMSFRTKSQVRVEEKKRIGERRPGSQDGETIILDSGTTTLHIVDHIVDRRGLTVITNALPIASRLVGQPHIRVIMPGGLVRPFSECLVGPETVRSLEHLNADRLFLAVEGIHYSRGLTAQDPLDAYVKRSMIRASREVLLVRDSSKSLVIKMVSVSDLSAVTMVVSDKCFPEDLRAALETDGLRVVLC